MNLSYPWEPKNQFSPCPNTASNSTFTSQWPAEDGIQRSVGRSVEPMLQCIDANNVILHSWVDSIGGWELLIKSTAPNAIHNSRPEYDAPKSDEDTPIEVPSEITGWIEDRDGPQRLLCVTGAAGSGISALQQKTAEECERNNILAASFFLSAADPTRNTANTVVPTIAYQLGRLNERLEWFIKTTVEKDLLIFTQSLKDQINALIVRPFEHIRDSGMDLRSLPYVILIDALDECKGEDRQAELLTAIRECFLVDGLPFRIFITSRPERAIRPALEPGGHLHAVACHIQL
ncbi:hypothetical protein EST38_g8121 [Candolleomyces aberdarensis]|uniref:Nephrocystin 3-like N-terminal domain-containing protein n=1 Tax=Candolleomyces aberdarensis TaxID=2316362 RepID=A0A4Q2DDF5_9AGAR|nr:hypothetical protein EST38_g8121 [Candolleomyces aberdarensis]